MLTLTSVRAGYGTFKALFDVSLEVRQGEAVGVIGPNGAGKTTLMRVVSGLLRPSGGSIVLEGVDLARTPGHRIVELGIAHVPESRRLFPRMTVEDNLKMGGFVPAARPKFPVSKIAKPGKTLFANSPVSPGKWPVAIADAFGIVRVADVQAERDLDVSAGNFLFEQAPELHFERVGARG